VHTYLTRASIGAKLFLEILSLAWRFWMETAIMVLGCDLADDGGKLGPETIARCECALKRFLELVSGGAEPGLVMNAGENKKRYPKQKDTMAMMMADWFVAHGVSCRSLHFVFSPLIWGTRAEVRSALDYTCFFHREFDEVEFVSSGYHLRRIQLIADRILKCAKQHTASPLPTAHCLETKYLSLTALLEIRNLPGEFVLGLLRPDWYEFTRPKWCN
jgi:hypothetical protein